ncbi:transposase [Streptomyces phaeoluteigriseus]|uniref:transposase n=1 Tax=Streptomyces phaeoluteigriseus TaxID=114686 RepID=UPI0026B55147
MKKATLEVPPRPRATGGSPAVARPTPRVHCWSAGAPAGVGLGLADPQPHHSLGLNSTASSAGWCARSTAGTPSPAPACSTPGAPWPPRTCRPPGQGIDAGKKTAGCKGHLGVATLGLLLAVAVTAASASDNVGGIHLLSGSLPQTSASEEPGPTLASVQTIDHCARVGNINIEAFHRNPTTKGFKVIPRCWVAERTFGWLVRHRRVAREYDTQPHLSQAMIRIAAIDLICRRLTSESTRNWRDTRPPTQHRPWGKTLFRFFS